MLRCLGKRSKQAKEQEDEANKPFEERGKQDENAASEPVATTSGGAGSSNATSEPTTAKPKSETVTKTSLSPVKTDPPTDGRHSFLRASRFGNLQKVTEHLNSGISIKTADGNGLNALHLASKEGHVNVVQELLNRGCEVDARTKKGNTALHIACLAGCLDVAKLLLDNGAAVNAQSQNGFTPLYMAAQENHSEVVKLLLSKDANQTLATDDGFTPSIVALQQGHEQIVALLLENDSRSKVRLPALHIAAKKDHVKAASLFLQQSDACVDQQSASGFTPLHIASHYGSSNVATLLIEHGADVNYQAKNNITPLHVAAKWGKTNVVKLLLEAGALPDCKTRDGLTPLHCATRSGHDKVCSELLQYNANFSAKTRNGLSPLHMAAQGDHLETTRVLLKAGANVDETTMDYLTPLHVAAHCGNVRVAKLFLDWDCQVNSRALNGFTPLHIACKKNWTKVIELLLKHDALVEATTESGLTPLHVAAFMGHMNIVVLLLQHGANVNSTTMRGETPLHLATRSGQLEIVRILLRNKPVVDAKARENTTPLHIASRLGNVNVAGVLLQHGANPENVTKDKYNCLHIAAKEGHHEVIAQILEHGAPVESVTKKGFTPLHIAAKYGRMPVTRLLLSKGANPNAQGQNGLTPLHLACHYNNPQVALLLLENQGNPHVAAKNGYTPLHIAAKKNEMDIAVNLLEYGAESNSESRNGFTPLHLASQEGHTDMISLLLQNQADANFKAKNGLTSLHLAAQEDRVPVAEILVANKAEIHPPTKAGYTPLHTACHFGQVNMIRYLLQQKAPLDIQTVTGYTPLHLAAQQGHLQVVRLLVDAGADPNVTNELGWTAAHIARRQHYLNIFEVLRKITTVVESWEEIEEEIMTTVVTPAQPDTIHEHAFSESEDEGGDNDFTTMPSSPLFARHSEMYRPYYEGLSSSKRSINERHSTASGEDSIHENLVSIDSRDLNYAFRPSEAEEEVKRSSALFAELPARPVLDFAPDNVPIARKPVTSGFLVSFMVDARGGSLSCSRHSGLRLIIPPGAASGPVRVICRMLRNEKVARPPPLNDGEGLACRVLEMGPNHIKFNTPILLEVPHHAALRGREREVVVLRSDNGDVWKEHAVVCNDQAISDTLGQGFDKLETCDELAEKRVLRILTNEFPQYFALVTRVRQDSGLVGPDGGVLSSTVVSKVQAVFPENALMKRIRVGLQAQVVPTDLVSKLLGNRVAVSPIVTIEPRRRQFHKPITLTIPSPQPVSKGMINPPGTEGKESNLRLLCSITGGTSPATWEDITGSMPLSVVKDCVSFTTKLSARFWLIHCQNVNEATEMGAILYREACLVPYIGKFVVFARRHDPDEAQLRAICLTDDKVDKTLECHEGFELKAASPEVEVLNERPVWMETAGNLIPVTKTGQQLQMPFTAFQENRISFLVRVKDPHQESVGKIAFMRDSRGLACGSASPGADTGAQKPLCTLEVRLPDNITSGIPGRSESRSTADQNRMVTITDVESWKMMLIETETIAKSELDLREIAESVGCDWSLLARELNIQQSDITQLKLDYRSDLERAFAMLILWRKEHGDEANGNALERGLRRIGREDVIKVCMKNIEYVHGDERAEAEVRLSGRSASQEPQDTRALNGQVGVADSLADAKDDLLVPQVDDRHGVFKVPDHQESEEARKAKTEAYLSLVDQLDIAGPTEEEMLAQVGLDETDEDADPVAEVPFHSKEVEKAEMPPHSELHEMEEDILTSATVKQVHAEFQPRERDLTPPRDRPHHRRSSVASVSSEEESFVDAEEKRGISQEPELFLDDRPQPPGKKGNTEYDYGAETSDLELSQYGQSLQSETSTSMTMTVSGISHISPPRDIPDSDPELRRSRSSSPRGSDDLAPTPTVDQPPTIWGEKAKTDSPRHSSEDEETAFQRAYERAVKTEGVQDEGDHSHHALRELHERTYGRPEETSQVEEIEEELEDGTIVKRRIVRTQVKQKVTERVIREGCPEALAAHAAKESSQQIRIEEPPQTSVEVEEYEETLPDGSVVKRRVEHTTVAEKVTVGDTFAAGESKEGVDPSRGMHPTGEDVVEVRETLPDGSIVIKRVVQQTHYHEPRMGAQVLETTTLDEGPSQDDNEAR